MIPWHNSAGKTAQPPHKPGGQITPMGKSPGPNLHGNKNARGSPLLLFHTLFQTASDPFPQTHWPLGCCWSGRQTQPALSCVCYCLEFSRFLSCSPPEAPHCIAIQAAAYFAHQWKNCQPIQASAPGDTAKHHPCSPVCTTVCNLRVFSSVDRQELRHTLLCINRQHITTKGTQLAAPSSAPLQYATGSSSATSQVSFRRR